MADENMLMRMGGVPAYQPPANPLTQAAGALNVMQGMQGMQLQQQALERQQFELGKARTQFVADRLGSLVTKPDLSFQDASTMVADMVRNRIVPPDEGATILQHFPQEPEKLRAAIKQSYASTLDHVNRMNFAFGQPGTVDNGNAIIPTMRNQMTGAMTASPGSVPRGTSPGERIVPVTVTDPSGNTVQTTVGQRAAAAGVDPVYGVPLQGAITRGKGQPAKAAPASPAAEQAVPGIVGPSAQFEPGLKALSADYQSANDTIKGMQPLLRALPLAEALGTTGTGPGTQAWNNAKAFLISNGVIKPDAKVDVRNELDKYLAQSVARSPLASRSDMGTIVSQAANPNTVSQTNAATVELIRNNIAQARMDAAAPLAYGDKNPSGYLPHKGSFAQAQNIDAYKIDLLQPEARKALIEKYRDMPLDDPKRKQFFESLKVAKTVGVSASGQ